MINNLQLRVVKSLISGSLMFAVPCVSLILSIPETASAAPKCDFRPVDNFSVAGSKVDSSWNEITDNEWSRMIGSSNWRDNQFHFYSRMRERGSAAGIHTPSDLRSEMRNGTDEPHPNPPQGVDRRRVRTNILSSKGSKRAFIIYDHKGGGRCEFVTFSYDAN